jgi:hypothetical protein
MLASDHNQSILISSIANYTWPCGQRFPISQGDRKWRLHAASLASIQVGKTITLDRLIEAGAWADAAITLVGFELPNWRLRRLVYDLLRAVAGAATDHSLESRETVLQFD